MEGGVCVSECAEEESSNTNFVSHAGFVPCFGLKHAQHNIEAIMELRITFICKSHLLTHILLHTNMQF